MSKEYPIMTRQFLARERVNTRAVLSFSSPALVSADVVAADERAEAQTLSVNPGARVNLLYST